MPAEIIQFPMINNTSHPDLWKVFIGCDPEILLLFDRYLEEMQKDAEPNQTQSEA